MQKETVKLYIDSKEIEARKGDNLLQLALDNGIDIPNLCYHKKISPTGACRLCLVKIEGQRGMITSCSTKVADGMKVTAFDEELEAHRKTILEYFLAEHNEDYDGTYHDELRDLTQRYDLQDPSKRSIPSFRVDLPAKDTSPSVLTYDAGKCIKCYRCVKACDEVQGKGVLSMTERGITTSVLAGTGTWDESECDGCGECVQLCPTGALVEKPYQDLLRMDKIDRKVKTTCPYCGVGCQMEMWVQDERIVRVTGVEGVLPNDGRMCVKGRFGYHFVQSGDRLKTPLIRKDGELHEATWDEALDLIATKFGEIKEKHGSKAFGGYASAKCTNEDNYLFQRFIRQVLGVNNLDNCARLCHASTVAASQMALGGGAGANSIEHYAEADVVYVTGNNIIETHPVTATYVKEGKAKGSKIIVVDPKWTKLVRYADVWLQPKIGTDVALLNGLIHVIIRDNLIDSEFISKRIESGWEAFEELKSLTAKYDPATVEEITGVPIQKLEEAAHIYGNAKKSLIATGMGLSQEVTGVNNVLSLINMALITGGSGKVGSGVNPPRGQNNVQGVSDVGGLAGTYPGYLSVADEANRSRIAKIWQVPEEQLSLIPGHTAVEMMLKAHEGEIKGMYIMGENPLISDPNLHHVEEALEKLDFLVVQDIFHNDTTPYADVILPAASFAEKDGTFSNSDRRVNRVRKVIDPPGQARADWEILCDLASRMGQPFPAYKSASEVFDEIAQATPIYGGMSWERIEHEGLQWPCPTADHPGTSNMFLDKYGTKSGLAILHPVEFVKQEEQTSEEYPLILNTGRVLYHYHTATMTRKSDTLKHFTNKTYILVNPDTAIKMGLAQDDHVKVSSPRGHVETYIEISDEVMAGEVFMHWHFNEARVNLLTRDELDPISKIPPYKLTAVRIDKI
jgi:formate dehydrogenase alpha subunit